jgi:hypothetical protein
MRTALGKVGLNQGHGWLRLTGSEQEADAVLLLLKDAPASKHVALLKEQCVKLVRRCSVCLARKTPLG